MATGMQLNTAWAKRCVGMKTTLGMVLRKETSIPVEQHWAWMNFYFGVDYAGTPTSLVFNESLGGASSASVPRASGFADAMPRTM